MAEQNIFSPILTDRERDNYLSLLVDTKTPIQVRWSADITQTLIPFLIRNGSELEVTFEGKPPPHFTSKTVVCNFMVTKVNFFMKTSIKEKNGKYLLDLKTTLFKLQRRDNFRLQFPKNFEAIVNIETVDGEALNSVHKIFDLNGGGIAFETQKLKAERFGTGLEITGVINIGLEFTYKFHGKIKHKTKIQAVEPFIIFGVEFLGISNRDRERIIQLVLRLHRELFSII